MNGQHSFKEEAVDTYFPELVDRNSWYVPGWVGGEGVEEWAEGKSSGQHNFKEDVDTDFPELADRN